MFLRLDFPIVFVRIDILIFCSKIELNYIQRDEVTGHTNGTYFKTKN